MIEIIPTSIKQVDKIFHIADIHIRNHIRHKEYEQVFQNLEKYINNNRTENSIIYVAGDLVHSKADMSPELVRMLSRFLTGLADLCPTLVILGNHDLNLQNINRLNSVEPVIDLIKSNPFYSNRLFLLSENGYYTFAQIGFSLMEVSTLPAEFKPATGLSTEIKIALHHGAINAAVTDLQVKIQNAEVPLSIFNGYDLVLLGDIHKRQVLQHRYESIQNNVKAIYPTIAYAGSLIQQHHGEYILGHGLLEWDLNSLTYREVDIPNEFGFFTLEVNQGNLINWDKTIIPSKLRLRIKYSETTSKDKKIIEAFIRKEKKILELSTQNVKVHTEGSASKRFKENISKVRDIEYQNKLITDFLTELNVPESILDNIRYINRITNSKLDKIEEAKILRNATWKPVRFEFSNMFSYGENNVIDFTTIEGIYGIFGTNTTGKSTIFDALCFCLFDKCSKTNKAKYVLNKNKSFFEAKLNLLINNVPYVIYKKGEIVSYKKNEENVKVTIDFYTFDQNGNKRSLNGDQRDSTTQIIRSYIGTYEDFTLTSLSVQNNGTNFIEKPQRERRELLVNFLDLKVFEELYSIANEYFLSSDLKSRVKAFKSEDYNSKAATAVLEVEELIKKVDLLKEDVRKYEHQLTDKTVEKDILLISMKDVVELPSKKVIESQIYNKETELSEAQNKLEVFEEALSNKIQEKEDLLEQLPSYDVEFYKDNELRLIQESQLKTDLETKIKINTTRIRDLRKHIQALDSHQYDPNCEFCVRHPTVKLGVSSKEELDKLTSEIEKLQKDLVDKTEYLGIMQKNAQDYKNFKELEKRLQNVENLIKLKTSELNSFEKDISIMEKELHNLHQVKEQIINNEKQIEINSEIYTKVAEKSKEIKELGESIRKLNTAIQHTTGLLYTKKEFLNKTLAHISAMKTLVEEFDAYTYYLQALKTDGIPYRLTNNILPDIEEEINNILLGVVDFRLQFEVDNKNINAYIVYGDDRSWPVESGSGMEKFVSSLAIRTALIGNTSLPKPNFICIDEGFGVLDSENLSNMSVLFDKMKQNFDTLFCITHIDSMKDIVESCITVSKINKNSFVSNL